jgi:hypothetical protein
MVSALGCKGAGAGGAAVALAVKKVDYTLDKGLFQAMSTDSKVRFEGTVMAGQSSHQVGSLMLFVAFSMRFNLYC